MVKPKEPHHLENVLKVFSISFLGSPGVGNKTAGTNLTLALTCNTLPRELKKYDMIKYEIHFPNEWLIYSIPIPGYSTQEDVERFMDNYKLNKPIILS